MKTRKRSSSQKFGGVIKLTVCSAKYVAELDNDEKELLKI